mgnify:CR=1 FL=1
MISGDTIVAQATPYGYSGTALIRISGPSSIKILSKLAGIKAFKPRFSTYSKIRSIDNAIIDYALVTSYPAPSSYTGENMAEITPHGNPALISEIIDTTCKLGARIAEPGEFTRRAFINGKMDLIQVEGVASLIRAKTKEAARAQQKIITGDLSTKLMRVKNNLISVLAVIENEIDISEELTQKETKKKIINSLKTIKKLADSLLASYEIGRLLFNGVDLVITGKPNVGKSTLFNRLAKSNLSIVNEKPGTTRNLIETELIINGAPVRVVDTAGLRKPGNPIEKEGVARAKKRIENADLVLRVVDNQKDALRFESTQKSLTIFNKMDLRKKTESKKSIIHISALTGAGVDGLIGSIKKEIGITSLSTDNTYLSTHRQKNALFCCSESVCRALDIVENQQPDLTTLSFETRDALNSIDALLGKTTADEILNEVFSSFCVGK